jgi:hypothetical protein
LIGLLISLSIGLFVGPLIPEAVVIASVGMVISWAVVELASGRAVSPTVVHTV